MFAIISTTVLHTCLSCFKYIDPKICCTWAHIMRIDIYSNRIKCVHRSQITYGNTCSSGNEHALRFNPSFTSHWASCMSFNKHNLFRFSIEPHNIVYYSLYIQSLRNHSIFAQKSNEITTDTNKQTLNFNLFIEVGFLMISFALEGRTMTYRRQRKYAASSSHIWPYNMHTLHAMQTNGF